MEDGGGLSASARVDLSALALGVPLIPGSALRLGKDPKDSLGVGGFGEVRRGFLLLRDGTQLRVALKRLTRLNLRFDDAKIRGDILREVGIMRGIDHINVLRCFGVVLDSAARDADGEPLGCCMVLELCPHRSLRDAIALMSYRDGERVGQGEAARLLASWANSIKVLVKVTAAFRLPPPLLMA